MHEEHQHEILLRNGKSKTQAYTDTMHLTTWTASSPALNMRDIATLTHLIIILTISAESSNLQRQSIYNILM